MLEKLPRVSAFDGPVDADGVQVSSGQDEFGRELPDPVPVAPPVGYTAPPSLADMIRRMVQNEFFNRAVEQEGFDTFEEGEDFEVEDDPLDPHTAYEAVFDVPAKAPPAVPGEGATNGATNVPSPNASPPVNPGGPGAGPGAGVVKADPAGSEVK